MLLEDLEQFANNVIHANCDYSTYTQLMELIRNQQEATCDNCAHKAETYYYISDNKKMINVEECPKHTYLRFAGSCEGLTCPEFTKKEQ